MRGVVRLKGRLQEERVNEGLERVIGGDDMVRRCFDRLKGVAREGVGGWVRFEMEEVREGRMEENMEEFVRGFEVECGGVVGIGLK
ncbi:hypothetical protein, partial [Bacillus pumilus]|uniref:hypothetical protein n=1 Tax=Bacillus pumilus TaxID=1408 RepID=UPI0011A70D1C